MSEEREGDTRHTVEIGSKRGRLGQCRRLNPSSSSDCCLFNLLTEDLIIDEILLKLSVNSLLRLRCVSRYFHSSITSPSFVTKHLDHHHHHHNSTSNALVLITCTVIRESINAIPIDEFQHFSCNFSVVDDLTVPEVVEEMPCPFKSVIIHSSCNGLLLLSNKKKHGCGYIWNPSTKEYQELHISPSIDEHLFEGIFGRKYPSDQGFCGFGYDRINDEYKILYYENRIDYLPGVVIGPNNVVSVTEFKLYTLGSGTWKSISDNPYKSLFFGTIWRKLIEIHENRIGLLVNGALHWIMSSVPPPSLSGCTISRCARNAMIISFNMEKEEFREVQKPHYSTRSLEEEEEYYYYEELQVLQECLCLCQLPKPNTMGTFDIWMLKDYIVKDSWTKLFTIVMPDDSLGIEYVKLLRFCKDGEIVMLLKKYPSSHLIVYDSKNHRGSRLNGIIDETTKNKWSHEVVYRESLVSLY